MTNVEIEIRARRMVIIVFAILSGISAVSTAVLPAIVHA